MLSINSRTTTGFDGNRVPPDELAVVIPVYQGRAVLRELCYRLIKSISDITDAFSIILVDDRGPDNAWPLIEALGREDGRIRGIQLSRNFGQHHALTAGIDHARARWYVIMDCDLQDAPEDIPLLYRKACEGYDIVVGARTKGGHSLVKRFTSRIFYKTFNFASGVNLDFSTGNFRIFSEHVAAGFREMREQLRFLPASMSWMGFEVGTVALPHYPRAVGKSTYTFKKLFHLASNTIMAHSQIPLKITALLGLVISALSFLAALFIVARVLLWNDSVLGWPSLIVSVFMIGGVQIFLTGVVGLYVGKCFEEAKRRPLYFVRATSNFGQSTVHTLVDGYAAQADVELGAP
jgi:polyisoprenyl-phosphate glycosyltransferase